MSLTELVVIWRVYEPCPLGCLFCGYSRDLERSRMIFDASEIERFGKLLGAFQECHGRRVLVTWLGGEPLLWPELPGLSRILHRQFGLRLGVSTSGLPLARRDVRSSLCADYEQLTVSLDGPADFHDRVRSAPGLFAKVRAWVGFLRGEAVGTALRLRVNTVLMRGNIGRFGEFCRELADWGIDEITFNPLGGNDRPEFYSANRLGPAQVERFREEFPELQRTMAATGLKLRGGPRYLERMHRSALGVDWPIADCLPASQTLFIDERARVAPCSFTADRYHVPLSEIRSVEDIAGLPARFARLRSSRSHPACSDCHATHVFDKFRDEPGFNEPAGELEPAPLLEIGTGPS
jgi:MoaA/NifB/PqqE/SkfB family radical SAM enzyme